MSRPKILLIIGSFIALIAGSISALIAGLAFIAVSAEWADFYLPNAPHFITFPPLTFGLHEYTVKLLITAFGGLLGVLSIFENKNSVPILSFTGLLIGTIGFLIPVTANQSSANILSVDVPWMGSLIALIGALLMFLGFALRNTKVPRYVIIVLPILLVAYSVAPILVLTDNLPIFIFMQANISMSTIVGVLILVGHLVIIWAGITGLRFPEKSNTQV